MDVGFTVGTAYIKFIGSFETQYDVFRLLQYNFDCWHEEMFPVTQSTAH